MLGAHVATYMPRGWHRGVTREVTTSEAVLLALLIAAPWLLRRPRSHPLTGVAFVLVASGVVGAFAAFYGDAIEIARHCYGPGQQIVLGLFLAVVARLDVSDSPLP